MRNESASREAESKPTQNDWLGENFLKDYVEWKKRRGESSSIEDLEKFRKKDSTSIEDLISELSKESLKDEAEHVHKLVRKKLRKPQVKREQEVFSKFDREASELTKKQSLKSTVSRTVFRIYR